jgi:hypothetical protein
VVVTNREEKATVARNREVHRQGKISLRCSIRDSILALQTLKESWRFVGDTRRLLGVCYVQVLSLRPPRNSPDIR